MSAVAILFGWLSEGKRSMSVGQVHWSSVCLFVPSLVPCPRAVSFLSQFNSYPGYFLTVIISWLEIYLLSQ